MTTMTDRMEKFFSPEIKVRHIRRSFMADDDESGKLLKELWGDLGFDEEDYDNVLEVASRKGYSLCTVNYKPPE